MTDLHPSEPKSKRQGFAWLSFLVFVVASLSFGSVLAFRDLPEYFGFDIDRVLTGFELLAAIVAALAILVGLFYFGAITWLLFARFVFTRREIATVVFTGPTTPVERWLFEKIAPAD